MPLIRARVPSETRAERRLQVTFSNTFPLGRPGGSSFDSPITSVALALALAVVECYFEGCRSQVCHGALSLYELLRL